MQRFYHYSNQRYDSYRMTHGDPSHDRSCDLSFGSILFLERCNMFQTSDCDNSKRCFLDLNFIDWKRFRLGHDSGYPSHYDKQEGDLRTTSLNCQAPLEPWIRLIFGHDRQFIITFEKMIGREKNGVTEMDF